MKKLILLFFGILVFDLVYIFVYDQFLMDIEPKFLQYPLIVIKYLVSFPAIFFNKLLPFYAPIPMYQSLLIFIGNVLIHTIFFKRKSGQISNTK